MDFGLQDRVALVAASSRGLGRAVAKELGAEGARLMLCARGQDVLEEARRAIAHETGAEVAAVVADLSESSGVDAVLQAANEAYGRVDILVTNSGGPPAGPFEAHDQAAWDLAIRQNFDSVVRLTRGVLDGMKARRWGRIINVTSIAVKQPVDNLILSNAVRAAVTGFAKTLANEVASFGITVNNVMPGYTRTRRLEELAERIARTTGVTPTEAAATWEAQVPMGRLGEPEEFAAMVAFLASDRASYVTGTSVPVDGGWIKTLL
jgi:3-oxoacyl-[acyl-carrier protein] reductase